MSSPRALAVERIRPGVRIIRHLTFCMFVDDLRTPHPPENPLGEPSALVETG